MPTIPQFLALDADDSNGKTNTYIRVYRDGNRTLVRGTLPDTASGPPNETPNLQLDPTSRIVRFKNLLVCVATATSGDGGVFTSSNQGETWTQTIDYSVEFVSGSEPLSQHLHVIHIDGVPTLCLALTINSDIRIGKSTDGTNWDFTPSLDLGTSSSAHGSDLVVGTKLYLAPMTTTTNTATSDYILIIEFNTPEIGELTIVDGINSSAGHGCFCYFNNQVYYAKSAVSYTTTDTINIWQVTNGNVILAQTITHTTGTDNRAEIKWDMFTDGTNMYLFSHHSNSEGWICNQMNSALTVTDITSNVIPSYMQQDSNDTIVRILTDQITDPTSPNYFIFTNIDTRAAELSPRYIVPWVMYQWQGSGTEMSLVDTGGSVVDFISWNKSRTQGAPFLSITNTNLVNPHVEILTKAAQTDGSIKIQFTIYGQLGTETVDVNGYYADRATEEYSVAQATLSNASHGTIVSNEIQGLTANGATIYQVTWEAATDGITEGENYAFNLQVALQ